MTDKNQAVPPAFEPSDGAENKARQPNLPPVVERGEGKDSKASEVHNRRGFIRKTVAALAAHPFIAGGSAVGTLAAEHGVPALKDGINATGIFAEAMLNPGIEESQDGKTVTITINPANVPGFSMEASDVAKKISSMGIYKLFLKNRTKVRSATLDQGTGTYTIVFEEAPSK